MLASLALLRQPAEVAHRLQSHTVEVEIAAQREVAVGGPQMWVDQAVDGSLHLVE